MKYLFPVLLVVIVLLPDTASAQLVTCEGTNCNFCDFVDMINIIIQWLIGILTGVAVLLIMVLGVKLVTSGGDTNAAQEAKKTLTNVVIGFILVLAAWLIVDTLLELLTDRGGLDDWGLVSCGYMVEPAWPGSPEEFANDPLNFDATRPPVAGCGGEDCVVLTAPCKSAASCTVSPAIVDNINAFHTEAGVAGARVTEAWPPTGYTTADPTGIHVSQCHGDGTCIDYGKAGGMTAAEINQTAQAAYNNSLRPVYEVQTQAEKDALVRAGAADSVIKVIPEITAPHFSIYGI